MVLSPTSSTTATVLSAVHEAAFLVPFQAFFNTPHPRLSYGPPAKEESPGLTWSWTKYCITIQIGIPAGIPRLSFSIASYPNIVPFSS